MKWMFTAFVCGKSDNILGYQLIDVGSFEICYKKVNEMKSFMKRTNVTNLKLDSNGNIVAHPYPEEKFSRIYEEGESVRFDVIVSYDEANNEWIAFDPVGGKRNDKKNNTSAIDESCVGIGKPECTLESATVMTVRMNGMISNAEFSVHADKDGKLVLSSTGTYRVIKGISKKKKLEQGEAAKKTLRNYKKEGLYLPPVVSRQSMEKSRMKELDEVTGLTVEQKLQYTKLALKETEPLLYAALCSLITEEAVDDYGERTWHTAYATLRGIYFFPDFVKRISLDELYAIHEHELYHILMKHHYRGEGKVAKVFNIACDLYVNKAIVEKHGMLRDPYSSTLLENVNRDRCQRKFYIKLGNGMCYSPHVDLDKDTPESLYEELMKQIEQKAKSKQSSSGQSSSGGGNGSGGQGGQPDSDEISDEELEQIIDELVKEFTKGGDEEQPEGGYHSDIAHTPDTAKKSRADLKQLSQAIQQRAKTIAKKQGYSLGKGLLDRYIEKSLAPKVNWKSLLKKKLTALNEKSNSFASPDRRFISRGKIYPGPRKVEGGALEKVLVAIDTSGSISDKELGIVLAQLHQLFQQYKVKGELTWWDTDCTPPEKFSKIDDIVRMKPKGGGGTDPTCVFEMLDNNKEYKRNQNNRPKILLVFTDGYFGEVDAKYGKLVDTIWIVFKSDVENFKPPFGVVAPFKADD